MNKCHVCGAYALVEVESFKKLYMTSSDGQLIHSQGELAVCNICGIVQKILSSNWHTQASYIYSKYNVYSPFKRSKTILNKLSSSLDFPEDGSILEIGCGNGQFLKLFGKQFPRWSLYGLELNNNHSSELSDIQGFKELFVGSPMDIEKSFDLIVMVHSLEHIPYPKQYIETLGNILKNGGYLVVEVPDYMVNPFDLIVADHCSHFNQSSLGALLQQSGLQLLFSTNNWLTNDVSAVAKKTDISSLITCHNDLGKHSFEEVFDKVMQQINWIVNVRNMSLDLLPYKPRGIFGTSTAAAWLFTELGGEVDFFVDEDINRIGYEYLGRPIYHPKFVPEGSHIFIALYPKLAKLIKERMERKYKNFRSYTYETMEDVIL